MSKPNDGNDVKSIDFNFPFTPYTIQKEFMQNLFNCLKEEKLGIFESPTGTGKSLSLICGALSWFIQHEKSRRIELQNQIDEARARQGDDEGDDWFSAQCKQLAERDITQQAEKELKALKLKDERMQELRHRRKTIRRSEYDKIDVEFDELFKNVDEVRDAVKRELDKINGENTLNEDEKDFAPGDIDYNSDDEDDINSDKKWNSEIHETEEDYSLRIYYCSRTHSQLSQFVKEIQKTTFKNDIRLVSLASRANMCINDSVSKLGNVSLINEACRELQKKKSSKKSKVDDNGRAVKKQKCSGGCQFFNKESIRTLQDQALLEVQDIEQLVAKGKKLNACPYYASRAAISDAQVVVLPYNTLLHKETREVCGINLKNSIVIVDEAHNLLDTISQIHSATVSSDILDYAAQQVNQYFSRYKARLLPKNLLYIKQVNFILTKMKKMLESTQASKLMSTFEFINESDIFNLDIIKLVRYIEKSKLAQKVGFLNDYLNSDKGKENENKKHNETVKKGVSGFLMEMKKQSSKSPVSKHQDKINLNVEKQQNEDLKNVNMPTSSTAPIIQITAFLKSLTNVHCEGRILISLLNDSIDESDHSKSIKYMLLNPSSQFSDIVSECRSIIVAGGTMHPLSEFRDQLFIQSGAKLDRIMNFSCDHVVPGENILPIVVKNGPSGRPLEFSFKSRDDTATMDELGRVICNICNMVPGGVVIFYPSYAYEKKVFAHFDKTGVLARIQKKKEIFREPKKGSEMDKVLKDYARNASKQGAILLSVVGGKMSEGINFSDALGRCVVMVGLPFPNIMSPELKERMDYLDGNAARSEDGRSAGQVHYENLCMKAVNQSIGRAIRHKGDYASIILVDHRYSRANIIKQLPRWIKEHVIVEEKFGPVIPKLHKFYKTKNSL